MDDELRGGCERQKKIRTSFFMTNAPTKTSATEPKNTIVAIIRTGLNIWGVLIRHRIEEIIIRNTRV